MAIVMAKAELPKSAPVEPVPPTVEVPIEVNPPEEDKFASKFATLAKKERWIKKLQDDVNKQKKEIEAKESEYKSNYVDKKRIKEEFLTVAMEAGLTPDQIANMLLNQPQGQADPAIREMKAEIEALKLELASSKTSSETKEKTQYDQAVSQIRSDAETLLASDGDTYETLKTKPNAAELVTQYIEETYKEEGRVLKVEDAATFIENELLEQALAMAKLKKVQTKLGLTAVQPDPVPKQQQTKTLTNTMTSSSNKLSSKDRYKRAIMRAQGLDPDAPRA